MREKQEKKESKKDIVENEESFVTDFLTGKLVEKEEVGKKLLWE